MKVFYQGERVQVVYVPLKMQGLAWALRADDAWRATVREVVQSCTPEVFRQMRRLFEEEARQGDSQA